MICSVKGWILYLTDLNFTKHKKMFLAKELNVKKNQFKDSSSFTWSRVLERVLTPFYPQENKKTEECVIRWKCSIHITNLNLPSFAEYFTNRMRLELKAINTVPSKNVYTVVKEHNMGWPQHLFSISLFSNCLKKKSKFMSSPTGRLRIMQIPLMCEEQKINFHG